MNWKDDPEINKQLDRRRAHSSLVRGAIIWMPLFIVTALAFLYFFFDEATGGDKGSWFLVFILLALAVLFGFQGIQPLLDLFTEPEIVTGYVTRRWSRSDSLVVRSHYIRIDNKQIFRIDRDLHGDVKEGDYLRIEHHSHSATVIEVEKLAKPAAEESSAPQVQPAP